MFFTPKSLVKMIVNVREPKRGILLDPACGSGGMFVQTSDFVNHAGMSANAAMTFYGQEKVEYNAQLCLMNIAVHGLNGKILSGNEANTFYKRNLQALHNPSPFMHLYPKTEKMGLYTQIHKRKNPYSRSSGKERKDCGDFLCDTT